MAEAESPKTPEFDRKQKRLYKKNAETKLGSADRMSIQYHPQDKQKEFSRQIASGKQVTLFLGGIRSGKTYAGSYEALKQIYVYNKQPALGWIVSPTYPMSMVVERAFEEAAGDLIIKKYRGERAYLLYPNKNSTVPFRVEIKTAENPDRLRGAGLSFIWIDEAAMITEEAWKILLGRILDTKGVIFMTTTPRGKNWLYKHVWEEATKNPKYAIVKARTLDNKYLDAADVSSLRSKYSEDFARQELEAEFVSFEGLVYKGFEHGRNTCRPWMDVPEGFEVIGGVDAGYADPFVHLWVAKRGGYFYVIDEYYEKFRTMEAHANSIKAARFNRLVSRRWADPSAAQERTDLEALGLASYPARNDIKSGINEVERMIEAGRLVIAQNCLKTLEEIGAYHYKPRDGKNMGEEPIDYMNHTMDALRYVIYSESMYQKTHPILIRNDDGTVEYSSEPGDPMSGKLEEWIKARSAGQLGLRDEDDLFAGAIGDDGWSD